jgi:preprotein translocase subunit SecD
VQRPAPDVRRPGQRVRHGGDYHLRAGRVVVEFDTADTSTLSDVTGKAIDKQLAALLNGKVLSAPTVKSAITTGKVTFAFGTASEAERVAAELGASPTS